MTLEFGDINNDTKFFSQMSRNSTCIELMVVHVSITGRMSVLQTVVLLKDIVLLVETLWCGKEMLTEGKHHST